MQIQKIIAEEVNVKKVEIKSGKEKKVELNIEITPELRNEGYVREIVRSVNSLRKTAGLTPKDRITLFLDPELEFLLRFEDEIAKSTISKKVIFQKNNLKHAGKVKLDEKEIWFGLEI